MAEPVDELFGEVRSLLHTAPACGAWEELCAVLDLAAEEDAARTREALVPYCAEALASWPDLLREVPEAWLVSLLYDGAPHPALSLGRSLRWPHELDAELAANLFDAHEHLAHLTHLAIKLEAWADEDLASPLGQLAASGDARCGVGAWFPRLHVLEVLGGWSDTTTYAPRAHAPNQLAAILGDVLDTHPSIRALILGEGAWHVTALGHRLRDHTPLALSSLGARDATLTCEGDTSCAIRWADGHRTPGPAPEVTLRYEHVWAADWETEPVEGRPGEVWFKAVRVIPTPAQRDENRAIRSLAHDAAHLFGTTTLSLLAPCTVAHRQTNPRFDYDDRILFFHDRWRGFEPRWI